MNKGKKDANNTGKYLFELPEERIAEKWLGALERVSSIEYIKKLRESYYGTF